MAEQLSFDLPGRPALGRGDFFVSPANALAVSLIDNSAAWPSGKLVLSGPAGSGKSHLAQVWAMQTGARIVAAHELQSDQIPELAESALAVEDVPGLSPVAQRALFHLHNLLQTEGQPLLMTGRGAPGSWALPLADLKSRIQAAQHVELQSPDDALLAAVLAKLFNDRQIVPKPDVIPYLLQRMERSFAAASDIVQRLDRAALSQKRSLSRPFCARVLGETRAND